MAHGGVSTAQAGVGGPKAAPTPSIQSESVQQKRDLASWWKTFKRSDKKAQEQHGTYSQNKMIFSPGMYGYGSLSVSEGRGQAGGLSHVAPARNSMRMKRVSMIIF